MRPFWRTQPPSDSQTLPQFAESQPSSAAQALEAGIALRQAGSPHAAIKRFEEALEADPELVPAREQLAETYLQCQEFALAVRQYDRLIRLAPAQTQHRRQRARCLAALGRHPEAIAELIACLKLAPTRPDETREALHALLYRADLGLARWLRDPSADGGLGLLDPEGLRILAGECLHMNRTLEAVAAYETLLASAPCCPAAMTGLAQALTVRGRREQAHAWLHKAIACDPGYLPALLGLGDLAIREGRPAEALSRFEGALAAAPGGWHAVLGKATALRELGHVDEADRSFHAAWGVERAAWPGIRQAHHAGLRSAHVEGARIVALDPQSFPRVIKGGILTDGPAPLYVHQLRADRAGPVVTTDIDYLSRQGEPSTTLPGCHLYAGPFLWHFGHFVSECGHRLWGYRHYRGEIDRVLVLPGPAGHGRPCPSDYEGLLPHQKQTLGLFGIPPERVAVVGTSARVEHLIVPEQASLLGAGSWPSGPYIDLLADNAREFFTHYPPAQTRYPAKLYVGRAHLIRQGGIAGESYLEKLLQGEGFHLFRPEAHSLHEQLNHYRHARLCVFSEGSAVHGLELLGHLDLRPVVVVLGRRPDSEALWGSVVGPRTPYYRFCACCLPLPALSYAANIQARTTWSALSLVHELDALLTFLREHLDVRLRAFQRDDFFMHEAADIAHYLLHTNINPADSRSGRYLEEFRRALRVASGNPYLSRAPTIL